MALFDFMTGKSLFEYEYEHNGGAILPEWDTDWKYLIAFDEDKDDRVLEFFKLYRDEEWMKFVYAIHEHEGILFLGVSNNYRQLQAEHFFSFPEGVEVPYDYWTVEIESLKDSQIKNILRLMGIDATAPQSGKLNYYEYIASKTWRARSDKAKQRAGNRCQVCNSSKALNTHHRTYQHLGNEPDEDLIVLCRDCHSLFHKQGKLAK